jgi:uncharacterized protein (TIGR02145 family)
MRNYLGFVAVSAFLLSCADVELERNNPYDALAYNYIGNASAEGSSSSVVYGTPVTYGSETYQTVVIGTQTWMAKNLNYNVTGSKCYEDVDCNTYGRFYDWATAMGLASSCNSASCLSQINGSHRGICPSGWHIPSSEDWGKLSRYVDGTTGTFAGYASSTAGKYLKAQSGWNPSSGIENLDIYGFSALPGGHSPNGSSADAAVGYFGGWWSAREANVATAYLRIMTYTHDDAGWTYYGKTNFHSVRCLQD